MIKKSMRELQENYPAMEALCLSSMEPIIFCLPWQDSIAMMNKCVYDSLVRNFDMSPYGVRLKRSDLIDYRQKVQICCEETGEPVFITDAKGTSIVFMDIILYNFLAGNPPEFEDDVPAISPKKRPNRSAKQICKDGAMVYSFADAAEKHRKGK